MTYIRPLDPMQPRASDRGGAQNPSCDAADTALPCCGARTRGGAPCRNYAMRNGRCRMHGGASTGPRTAAGIDRMRAAKTIHGGRSREMAEFRRAMRELRAEARRTIELA